MKIYNRHIYIYLLSCFIAFLSTSIWADEVWRCKSTKGQCIFAWWLHSSMDGKDILSTTAGKSFYFTRSEGGKFNFAMGPSHPNENGNEPEWIAHLVQDNGPHTEIWYIEFSGLKPGIYTNAVCKQVTLTDNSRFGEGCRKYYYKTNGYDRMGKFSEFGTGGAISGEEVPATVIHGALPTIDEQSTLCSETKEQHRTACEGTTQKKNALCCNLM